MKTNLFSTLLTLSAVIITTEASTDAIENIARGKNYTISPRPNYGYCTDPSDATQLTDGEYSKGYFWTQKTTVGWQNAGMVQITIDLGEIHPIRGVSFNTAAGVAGVAWPGSIQILTSDDGKTYFSAGELISQSLAHGLPPAQGYRVHRYWTDAIESRGRYVKLLVSPGSQYVFVDEVEVYAGDKSLLSKPRSGAPIKDIKDYFWRGKVAAGIQRRINLDAELLRKHVDAAHVAESDRLSLLNQLAAVSKEASNLPPLAPTDFRAVLPLNNVHERLFKVQAALWRSERRQPMIVWQSPIWDPLCPTDDLPNHLDLPRIDVSLMRGEYRAGAFNVSNTTDHDLNLRLTIDGLPGGRNPEWVSVHKVAWTDTKSGAPVADALPVLEQKEGSFHVRVPSGMTRQIWLTFHPGRNGMPSDKVSNLQGQIIMRADGVRTASVPLCVRLYPLDFPSAPSLHLGGWDYTDAETRYGVTRENRAVFIATLREHFVDTPWATSAVMPAEPSFNKLDRWLGDWNDARCYRIFLSVGNTFSGATAGTPEFNTRVGKWISTYVSHIRSIGKKPRQFGLLLVDEPTKHEQDETISAWAKAIHAAEPEILIWEDPCHKDPAKSLAMFSVCDVLCPNRPAFLEAGSAYREVYANQRTAGRVLNFYSCSGPVRLLDPYSYHRLQAWTCWQQGAVAEFFWAFGDNGGASTWNEYAAGGTCYTPLFLDQQEVTTAKHMEAIREGVEDFEYLTMLRDKLAALNKAGTVSATVEKAKVTLETATERVLGAAGANKLMWCDTKDRTVADHVRKQVLDLLVSLPKP